MAEIVDKSLPRAPECMNRRPQNAEHIAQELSQSHRWN
ncbi:hypothetical protein I546_5594 [Mycobacterium kansasii 732]|nr:hypothetical protein I546_5594 [Mycobacterium kansasii 732]